MRDYRQCLAFRVVLSLLAAAFVPGCDARNGGGSGDGGAAGSGGGGAAAGSGGGGGAIQCTPGETQSCYSGPDGTEGVGECTAGQQVCDDTGTSFGPCAGEVLPQPEDCATPESESCGAPACGATSWAKSLGTGNATAMGVDASGNILLLETTPDLTLKKLDPQGALVWQRNFSGDVGTLDFTVLPDGSMVLAGAVFDWWLNIGQSFNADQGFVVKLDAEGKVVWGKAISSWDKAAVLDAAVDPAGNIVLTGWFESHLNIGNLVSVGNRDTFVIKLSSGGTVLWAKQFGSTNDNVGEAIAVDSQSNIVLAAYAGFNEVDYGGGGIPQMALVKLSPDGAHVWSKPSVLGAYDVWASSVDLVTDSSDNIWAAGNLGPNTVGIARVSSTGELQWAQGLSADPSAIAPSGTGAVVTGCVQSYLDLPGSSVFSLGGCDAFVLAVDASGKHVWSHGFGNTLQDTGAGVAFAPDGGVMVAGSFTGTVDFGSEVLDSPAEPSVFVAKLSP